MNKMWEFFQDNSGIRSMSRLTCLGAFMVASVIMLWITYLHNMNEGYLTIYLTTFTGAYLYSKKLDGNNANSNNNLPANS